MKTEHEQYLRTTYSLLYSEPYLPCDGGFRCRDGWFDLINRLSMRLEAEIAKQPEAERGQYRTAQVKEKFAGLRFYMDGETPAMSELIRMAEVESASICEECGDPGELRGGGWIRTLCDVHEAARQRNRK
jgi:hypothetical protein